MCTYPARLWGTSGTQSRCGPPPRLARETSLTKEPLTCSARLGREGASLVQECDLGEEGLGSGSLPAGVSSGHPRFQVWVFIPTASRSLRRAPVE